MVELDHNPAFPELRQGLKRSLDSAKEEGLNRVKVDLGVIDMGQGGSRFGGSLYQRLAGTGLPSLVSRLATLARDLPNSVPPGNLPIIFCCVR